MVSSSSTFLSSLQVLAVVTVGFGFVDNTKRPPTSGWITAMDMYGLSIIVIIIIIIILIIVTNIPCYRYILFCFLMVFLAFVEFAFISFIGIFIRRLKITDAVIMASNLILEN